MVNTIFIKENFIRELASSITSVEEAKAIFKDSASEGIFYNIVNRKEYLKETCQALNTNEQKLFFIKGFQGTGKTEFLNTLVYALEENVLNFYYECSSITHLDDIILSLFNYLKRIAAKTSDYKRSFKITNSQSIDERLMNYIKSLNRPLLIIIDGFENFSEEQKEFFSFLEFISSLPEIKIILSGRKANASGFLNAENLYEIRLGALEEEEAYKVLENNGINETESCLQQIFQVTRGYPESLLLFSNAVNTLKTNSFNLMQEYYSQEQKSFEEFIYRKTYDAMPEGFPGIINFFTIIRHAVSNATLERLDLFPDISKKTGYLSSKMMLTNNRDGFYIKSLLKEAIYSSISVEEKIHIHRFLYEIYSDQISKKLEERIFPISRKLLYSEQYYHYKCLMNFGDKSLSDLKNSTYSGLKPDFKYLYANIADSLFTENSQISFPKTDISSEEKQNNAENTLTIEKEDISGFDIELSPDEKELLDEESGIEADISENNTEFKIDSSPLKQVPDSEKKQLKAEQPALEKQTKKPSLAASQLEEKIIILKSQANILYKQGKFDEAARRYEEVLILYEILRDRQNINKTLALIAGAYYEGFRHDISLSYYYRLLNTDGRVLSPEAKIETLCGIADIYNYREDFDNAISFYKNALLEAEKSGNVKHIATICFKKALAYDDFGDFDRALKFYSRSIDLFTALNIEESKKGDTLTDLQAEFIPDISAAYSNMAAIHQEREDLDKAKEYFLESLKFDKLVNNLEGQYETLSNIGNIYFEMEDYHNANDYFHEALSTAKTLKDAYKTAMSCLDIGDVYLMEKSYEKALKAFIIAGKTIEETISTDSREKIDRRLKKVLNEIGEHHFKQIIEKLKRKNG